MRARRTVALAAVAVLLAAGGCSSDGSDGADEANGDEAAAADDGSATDTGGDGDSDASFGGGGASGTLTLDGEDIELGSGRCFLEEQPAAVGGGSIEATAQAEGTDADGDPVTLDFTRFSADNQFAGDDVSLTLGDPFDPESVTLSGSSESGTVSIDGSTVSASDFEVSEDLADTVFISFTIDC